MKKFEPFFSWKSVLHLELFRVSANWYLRIEISENWWKIESFFRSDLWILENCRAERWKVRYLCISVWHSGNVSFCHCGPSVWGIALQSADAVPIMFYCGNKTVRFQLWHHAAADLREWELNACPDTPEDTKVTFRTEMSKNWGKRAVNEFKGFSWKSRLLDAICGNLRDDGVCSSYASEGYKKQTLGVCVCITSSAEIRMEIHTLKAI